MSKSILLSLIFAALVILVAISVSHQSAEIHLAESLTCESDYLDVIRLSEEVGGEIVEDVRSGPYRNRTMDIAIANRHFFIIDFHLSDKVGLVYQYSRRSFLFWPLGESSRIVLDCTGRGQSGTLPPVS